MTRMSPGAKLTVFMILALAIFFAIKWVLARVLGPYPGPSADRPENPSMPSAGDVSRLDGVILAVIRSRAASQAGGK